MSTAIEKTENAKVNGWLDRPGTKERLCNALSGWMASDEFVAQFFIACLDPKIAVCTDKSKFEAAHLCASLQLLPNLGHVALIPRKDECTVMPQWQGYKAIMERNPEVLEVDHDLVFEGEAYARHSDGSFTHNYDPFVNRDVQKDFARLRGGYLRIRYRDSRPDKFHFVTLESIKKARACAQTKNVWDKWPKPMAIKTLYRDGYARRVVPIDAASNRGLQQLIEAEDRALANNPNKPQVSVSSLNKSLPAPPPVDLSQPQTPPEEDDDGYDEDEVRDVASACATVEEIDTLLESFIRRWPEREQDLMSIFIPKREELEAITVE